jgi:16S rRNA (guanine(966)-N(2))-methyltransferase RsmD
MRIIGGEFRSRRLSFPKNRKTRPMSDRMRETLFNILGSEVQGARVLDLFAGSGSLGLEALSRGASEVTFVEGGIWAQKTLSKNLGDLGLESRGRLLGQEVFSALRQVSQKGEKFSLIFLDPPYNKGLVKKLLIHLDHSDILAPFTQVIVHRSRQEKLPEPLERLKVLREKEIGQACLSFLSTGQ